jgi:hypothetical protein
VDEDLFGFLRIIFERLGTEKGAFLAEFITLIRFLQNDSYKIPTKLYFHRQAFIAWSLIYKNA